MMASLRYFLPYQRAWIDDRARTAIAEKSRRIGFTYAESYRSVERRVLKRTNHYFASRDLESAGEFIDYCRMWVRVLQVQAKYIGKQLIDERTGLKAFVLRFANGSKIVALSSNPDAFRSRGGDVTLDEFAFHPNPRAVLKAANASAKVWGHSLRIISTHNGEGSLFNQIVTSINNGARRWSLHRVTLIDAVEQGLAERIRGVPSPNEEVRQQLLNEIRSDCLDPGEWDEEYLCIPGSDETSLLSYDLIQGCEASDLPAWDLVGRELPMSGLLAQRDAHPSVLSQAAPNAPRAAGRRVGATAKPADEDGSSRSADGTPAQPDLPADALLYAGYDVAHKHDLSALWVLEKVHDTHRTCLCRTFQQMNFSAQEDLLHLLLSDRRLRRLCIDATGLGAMLAERLKQRWGSRVEAITFSAPVKSDLALPLLRLFQDKLIRIPADASLREDLHKVRKIITASNNIRLDADRDSTGHADRFWALALAYHAAHTAKPPLPAPLWRKPLGW